MDLEKKTLGQLYEIAKDMNIYNYSTMDRSLLIYAIKKSLEKQRAKKEKQEQLQEQEAVIEKPIEAPPIFNMGGTMRGKKKKPVRGRPVAEENLEDEDEPEAPIVKRKKKKVATKVGAPKRTTSKRTTSKRGKRNPVVKKKTATAKEKRVNPALDISKRVVNFHEVGRRAALETLRKKGLTVQEATSMRRNIATNLDLSGKHLAEFNAGWLDAFQKHIVPTQALNGEGKPKSRKK